MNTQFLGIEVKQPKDWHSFMLDKEDTTEVIHLCKRFGANKSEFFRQAIRNEIRRLKELSAGTHTH